MIENPYRMIRRKLKIGGRALHLASSTISRIESGQYEELSTGMVEALFKAAEQAGADFDVLAAELEERFGTPYLAEAYRRWRRMKRRSEGDKATWPELSEVQARQRDGESPMGAFARLTAVSVDRFCSRFCVQEPTLTRYIEGRAGGKVLTYFEPPLAVREALTEAGYDELEELFEMQRRWLDG